MQAALTVSRQTGQSAAPLTVSRQTGRSAGTTYCVQTDTQAPLTDCIQAETTPLTDCIQADTTPLTDCIQAETTPLTDCIQAETTPLTDCIQAETTPLTDCIQAETTPLTDSVQAETTPLTDSVPHAIPIKVWTQQTDGDLLEVAAEIAEGHPELSIITGLHLDLPLGGLIHPLPVHVADTGRKFAYQPSP